MYQNTIPSTAHDGVLKVAAEAETLPQPTAVLISGDDRKTDDEGFRAHGSTIGSSSKPPSLNDGGADLFKRVTFDQVLKSVESSRER